MASQGENIGRSIGSFIGSSKKKEDYAKAARKILADGRAFKEHAFVLIPEATLIFEKYSKIYEISLHEYLNSLTIGKAEDDFGVEREVKNLKKEVCKLYQIEYRKILNLLIPISYIMIRGLNDYIHVLKIILIRIFVQNSKYIRKI